MLSNPVLITHGSKWEDFIALLCFLAVGTLQEVGSCWPNALPAHSQQSKRDQKANWSCWVGGKLKGVDGQTGGAGPVHYYEATSISSCLWFLMGKKPKNLEKLFFGANGQFLMHEILSTNHMLTFLGIVHFQMASTSHRSILPSPHSLFPSFQKCRAFSSVGSSPPSNSTMVVKLFDGFVFFYLSQQPIVPLLTDIHGWLPKLYLQAMKSFWCVQIKLLLKIQEEDGAFFFFVLASWPNKTEHISVPPGPVYCLPTSTCNRNSICVSIRVLTKVVFIIFVGTVHLKDCIFSLALFHDGSNPDSLPSHPLPTSTILK